MNAMKRQAGFTLVELLVVLSLAALIGISLYAMFASSIGMMRRVSGSEVAENVSVFLEKIDREVSSQVLFKGIAFEGKETSVSFPSRINTDKRAVMNQGIGRVTYLYDESNRALARKQENANQIFKPEDDEEAPRVLENVTIVKFRYFIYRKAEKIFEWVDVWSSLENEGQLPAAVSLEFESVSGEEKHVFERTIPIPIADISR